MGNGFAMKSNLSQLENRQLPVMSELWQQTLQWQPNPQQQQQFQQLYQEIVDGNRQLNLTRITEPEDFWEKHLWDSLTGILRLNSIERDKPLKIIDIGTGAGFPGLPIAIVCPIWQVSVLDSTQKKITFINGLLNGLNLDNVDTLVGRAEILGRQPNSRESYDIAVIRAVSDASACAEYALPLVKIGGTVILYRGSWQETDTPALASVVERLGGKIEHLDRLLTPLTQSIRHCIYLRKERSTTSQFPRAVGIPSKQPL
jgi:16S rRNA (guanine527-N7)-methyltransferase